MGTSCAAHIEYIEKYQRIFFDVSFEMSLIDSTPVLLSAVLLQNFPLPFCPKLCSFISPKISDFSKCSYTLVDFHVCFELLELRM